MSARKTFRYAADIRRELSFVDAEESERSRKWVESRVSLLPWHWSRDVIAQFVQRGGAACADACRWLLESTLPGEGGRVPLSASDSDLRVAAKVAVAEAKSIAQVTMSGSRSVLESLSHTCERWGVVPARPAKPSDAGPTDCWPAVRRMVCERWWIRGLRRATGRKCEAAAIRAGLVRRGKWAYVSQDCLVRRLQQRARSAEAIEGAVLTDTDTGEQVPMSAVVAGSIANPEIRRGELMTRIRGFDEYAMEQGWSAEFWTLTAPSRFHAQRTIGAVSEQNPKYGGESPRAAHAYLCAVWARARASWARRGLIIAGLRTVEPHHDGCPHWHLVVYGPKRDLRFARRLLRVYALRDSAGEPGAKQRRFVAKVSIGASGAAYAAKYVAKNIDGAGLEGCRDSETGRHVASVVDRVLAWSATWGIRQFQFFGAPKVTAWRVLRRVSEPCGPADVPLERARLAADEGSWAGFWRAWRDGEFSLLRDDAVVKLTEYGDRAVARVVGVVESGMRAVMEIRSWVVKWGAARRESGGGVGRFGPSLDLCE